ncbi:MAG: hypothetical protein ACP6IQ_05840 [Candidatus Njordarchaeia archaeon]|nr:bifunctional nuclease family protein [Candidatus Korarchaeota archaeon]
MVKKDIEDVSDEYFDRSLYLKVAKIRPLFPLPLTTMPPTSVMMNPTILANLTKPVLEMRLEDGKLFRMGGIPPTIAIEIWEVLESRKNTALDLERRDPRLTLSQAIIEMAEVKRAKITDILPKFNVYVAEIDLIPEGFGKPITLRMIPSHAILIALRAGASIFVSKDLVENNGSESSEDMETTGNFYDV